MKQFEFRLQKVMETTRAKEDLQKKELALALAELDRQERKLDEMIDNLNEELDQFSVRSREGSLKVSAMRQYADYTDKLMKDIHNQRDELKKMAELVETHREKLLEITKDKKILERLKEKRYEEYRKKLRQVEQKFMDELSVRNYHDGAD